MLPAFAIFTKQLHTTFSIVICKLLKVYDRTVSPIYYIYILLLLLLNKYNSCNKMLYTVRYH